MIVLDTNVVSELMRAEPAPPVIDWADRQPAKDLCLTAITVAEILYGIGRLPEGRRRTGVAEEIKRMLDEDFEHRVLSFDEVAAGHFADIAVRRVRAGLSIATADSQIASICRSHGAALATRNLKDFTYSGVDLIDPWTAPE